MNFIQQTSRYDHEGKARHYQRTYEYRDEQGAVQWDCDVFGSCISAPTVFTPQAPGREGFTMTANSAWAWAAMLANRLKMNVSLFIRTSSPEPMKRRCESPSRQSNCPTGHPVKRF